MARSELLIPDGRIEKAILLIRGHKVLLDADLAELYGVETKALTRQVKRNPRRFPGDFMFQLTAAEWDALRRQIGTSKGRGGRRYAIYCRSFCRFTGGQIIRRDRWIGGCRVGGGHASNAQDSQRGACTLWSRARSGA